MKKGTNINKKALIIGVSGQDGAYLAKLLLKNNYRVWGTSRDAQLSQFFGLEQLNIKDKVKKISMNPSDFYSVIKVIKKIKPDEIYNLSGQSSVGLSFEQPVETFNSISVSNLNILESIRHVNPKIKFYNASSSEMFGDTKGSPAKENSPFKPKSPYAVAKAAAHWQVSSYRDGYGLFACSGILFNHESILRPSRFVTMKIIDSVCKIASGSAKKLTLGNIDIKRDWGHAEEYVDAMWKMMQAKNPDDYIIATGKTYSLMDFIKKSFSYFNLEWEKYVVLDDSLKRPSDISLSLADPTKAAKQLNWKAKIDMNDLVELMIKGKLNESG
ncbi:MAG: GDP-mannose 4,6-dehydratase [Candidatus Marinimicrobia bacterium]|nr:GDP-mannose 4,6-dehydratase [Candidatus Neomarinimicrobiota bacterium]|tara:strand:+ start:104 stop:1087 length:984 start_codon:yes stop_codon:yes gene_type:complete